MFKHQRLNNFVYGAFIGFLILSFFVPVFLVLGLTKLTFVFLLYLIPLSGAVVGFYLSPKTESVNENTNKNNTKEANTLAGKWATVHTKDGVYKGYVKDINANMLLLGSVSKEGTEHKIDNMFLERSSIEKIEIDAPRINRPDIA